MNELILTVGLPQSGKSTWAREQGIPIVNPDSIRYGLHGQPFIGLAEPFVWAIAKVMVRSLFLVGHKRLILDATNTTRARREEWKSEDWVRSYRVFDELVATCYQRASENFKNSSHLEGVIAAIERMHKQFESVEGDEWDDTD